MKREQLFLDGNGESFFTYRRHLPKRASDFESVKKQRNASIIKQFVSQRLAQFCWSCGRTIADVDRLETHHIMGGAGRTDERCNLSRLCGGFTDDACHAKANTDELPLDFMLMRKWAIDPDGTAWLRLAQIRGSFLPPLRFSPPSDVMAWDHMLNGADRALSRQQYVKLCDRSYNCCEWYHDERSRFDSGEDVAGKGVTG